VNAIITVDAERARRRADDADRALARGEVWGPLHGLPVTVKDQFQTAGIRTTCGAEEWADFVPEVDAVPVARLLAAGAVLFGKTNTPALTGDWQTSNSLFGTTRNPWDLERSPGGSSGGSAAALAAGLTALELGGDIGGSVRIPAAWCGVYGHKPTWGIVPGRGSLPSPPGTLARVDVASPGPLGRSADDLELALGVLAGPDEWDAAGWRLELPPPRGPRLRAGLWVEDPSQPIAAEARSGVEAAAAALAEAGAEVTPVRPFDLAELTRLRRRLVYPIIARRATDEELGRLDAERARWAAQSHRDWLDADEERQRVRARCADLFRDLDVLLCPVAPVAAIPHDPRPRAERTLLVDGVERPYGELGSWISLAGVALLPATSAPAVRTADGLPLAVQIVGPYLEDRTTIGVARRLAEVLGGFEPPPGFSETAAAAPGA
jgi:amidase